MKLKFRALALLLALALMPLTLPALMEGELPTVPAGDESTQVLPEAEAPAEEAPAEGEATPAVDTPAETAPEAGAPPYATMAPTDKKDMPKPNPDAKAEAFVIKADGIALFELPVPESAILAHLNAGQALELKALGQTWSRVAFGSQEGYVPTRDLSFVHGFLQPALAIVTAPGGKLTLRQEMTTQSKALGTVPSGRAVLLMARGETFSLVRFEGKEGYVLTAHLNEVPAGQDLGLLMQVVSIVTDREANVRLRAEPSRQGVEYTKIKSGNSVVVLDITEDWARIEFEGYHGYMMAEYLKRFD